MLDDSARHRLVQLARGWIGTPYRHNARLQGIGVDCGQLPLAVYAEAGLIPELPIDHMPPQIHLHTETTSYLDTVLTYTREMPEPTGPGDFVLFHVAKAWHHGGIITQWPRIIHANSEAGLVMEEDASIAPLARKILIDRHPRFFTVMA